MYQFFRGKVLSVTYFECVCSLRYQHEKCMCHVRYSSVASLRLYSMFPHYLIHSTILRKNVIENNMCFYIR
jgi:hypothetical protein